MEGDKIEGENPQVDDAMLPRTVMAAAEGEGKLVTKRCKMFFTTTICKLIRARLS